MARAQGLVRVLQCAVLAYIFAPGSGCQPSLAQSHIDANVPDKHVFEAFLKRDLEAYFGRTLKGAATRVDYKLLRQGPTQTGIAYPKFYLWTKVYNGKATVAEGAVRVAAVARERFDITHFLSKDEIVAEPGKVDLVFPAALKTKILRLARSNRALGSTPVLRQASAGFLEMAPCRQLANSASSGPFPS